MNIIKTCWYFICAALWTFYNHYGSLYDLLVILWIADNITGILKYYRLWRLTSKWLWYGTIVKTLMLWIPFLVAKAADAFGLWYRVLSLVFSILCFAEFISNIQNLKVAKTGIEESEQDVITKLLDGILVIGNKVFEWTLLKLQNASQTLLDKRIDDVLVPKK